MWSESLVPSVSVWACGRPQDLSEGLTARVPCLGRRTVLVTLTVSGTLRFTLGHSSLTQCPTGDTTHLLLVLPRPVDGSGPQQRRVQRGPCRNCVSPRTLQGSCLRPRPVCPRFLCPVGRGVVSPRRPSG